MRKHIPLHRGFINLNNEMTDKYYYYPHFEGRIFESSLGKCIMVTFRLGAFRFYIGWYYKKHYQAIS